VPDPALNEFEQSCLTGPQPPWLIRATASLKDRLGLNLRPAVAIVFRRAEALGLCTSTACTACAQGAVGLHYGPARADGRPGPQCQEGRLYVFPE
jgi:hypothetical protein